MAVDRGCWRGRGRCGDVKRGLVEKPLETLGLGGVLRFMRPGCAEVQLTPVANSKVFWEKTGMWDGGRGEEFGCHHGRAF